MSNARERIFTPLIAVQHVNALRRRFRDRRFIFAVDAVGVHVREITLTERALDDSSQTYHVVPICSGKTFVEAVALADARDWGPQ